MMLSVLIRPCVTGGVPQALHELACMRARAGVQGGQTCSLPPQPSASVLFLCSVLVLSCVGHVPLSLHSSLCVNGAGAGATAALCVCVCTCVRACVRE